MSRRPPVSGCLGRLGREQTHGATDESRGEIHHAHRREFAGLATGLRNVAEPPDPGRAGRAGTRPRGRGRGGHLRGRPGLGGGAGDRFCGGSPGGGRSRSGRWHVPGGAGGGEPGGADRPAEGTDRRGHVSGGPRAFGRPNAGLGDGRPSGESG
ncbi:protein of unknown function [Kyrpidia spormannii]|uniref:Uncharacterized protein n=1 Tax=Kyrpidia spormannii TaxID=2055160 RepID=A0ACA8ZCG8_9BACL|nr:protein of unknown function [Kyrpidia spormannii]